MKAVGAPGAAGRMLEALAGEAAGRLLLIRGEGYCSGNGGRIASGRPALLQAGTSWADNLGNFQCEV